MGQEEQAGLPGGDTDGGNTGGSTVRLLKPWSEGTTGCIIMLMLAPRWRYKMLMQANKNRELNGINVILKI